MVCVTFLFLPKKCEIPCRSSAMTLAKQMTSGSRGSGSHRGGSPEEVKAWEGVGDPWTDPWVDPLVDLLVAML